MDEKKFDRIEKKYLIDNTIKKKLLAAIKKKMEKDQYFKSEILNIYFDTDNFDLIIKNPSSPKRGKFGFFFLLLNNINLICTAEYVHNNR